jgi:hypothetical protein
MTQDNATRSERPVSRLLMISRWLRVGERDGLPSASTLLAFPALLLIAGTFLVGFAINGSSSGAFYDQIHSGQDPALLAGKPEAIRSDEWNVNTVWTISQIQQGLPARNQTFPGGMDAELPFDLPHAQPSIVLEPQLWGYLFLDPNHAIAWQWWLPGLALMAGAYVLMTSLLPRRPVVAAALSVGYFFSPFFQWWYTSSTLWTAAWGVLTAAALVWAVKSTSLRARIIWAIPVGFVTAVMATGIYAPFIIPVVLVVLFFAIGLVLDGLRRGQLWRTLLIRLVPIAVAAVAAAAIVLLWLQTKASTVNGFLGTVYPGARSTPTGTGSVLSFVRAIGSSFVESLSNDGGFLGTNSSEASSFFFLGIFLLPVGIWIAARRVRQRAVLPWISIGLLAILLVFIAFMFVPGWDAIAHLLFLDRSTPDRVRIGIGFASFLLIGSLVRDSDQEGRKPPRAVVWVAVGLFAASQLAIAAAILKVQAEEKLWGAAPFWWLFALLSSAAIYLFARRRVTWGTAAFLVLTIAGSALVNPIYVGVLDLRKTQVSRDIVATNKAHPARWVGIGAPLVTALLLESGVHAYDGTQGAPSKLMWRQIDPRSQYADEWNRLGAIVWNPGVGEPVATNPAADVIQLTFDACSHFAQRNVGYVLSDDTTLRSPCLTLIRSSRLPTTTVSTYKVIPKTAIAGTH